MASNMDMDEAYFTDAAIELFAAAWVYRELVNSGVIPMNMSPAIIGQLVLAEGIMQNFRDRYEAPELARLVNTRLGLMKDESVTKDESGELARDQRQDPDMGQQQDQQQDQQQEKESDNEEVSN